MSLFLSFDHMWYFPMLLMGRLFEAGTLLVSAAQLRPRTASRGRPGPTGTGTPELQKELRPVGSVPLVSTLFHSRAQGQGAGEESSVDGWMHRLGSTALTDPAPTLGDITTPPPTATAAGCPRVSEDDPAGCPQLKQKGSPFIFLGRICTLTCLHGRLTVMGETRDRSGGGMG